MYEIVERNISKAMTKRKHENPQKRRKKKRPGHSPSKNGQSEERTDDKFWIYGAHAALAALKNPRRSILKVLATPNGAKSLDHELWTPEIVHPRDLDQALPPGAVHQGLAVLTKPLDNWPLADLAPADSDDVVVILDQVTDPHNVGAILRSCAAFGVKGVIVQSRHCPPLSGVVAKAATGALEYIPITLVTNISRALETLAEMQYEIVGLAEEGAITLPDYQRSGPAALVLGAEGSGLRRLTREKCHQLVNLPTSDLQPSLNVSNAAAVALYAMKS